MLTTTSQATFAHKNGVSFTTYRINILRSKTDPVSESKELFRR
ncbi:hypothetical protein [Spirosoma terrae]|nr:hypothetical protein [Spirosoma terrae]